MQLRVIGFWGGYPAVGEATSCYVLEKDGFTLVIDMGSGALSTLQKYYDIEQIDAVILSHYHHDHMADIGVLQYAKLVHMYLGKGDDLLPIYGHDEDDRFYDLTHDQTVAKQYLPGETLMVGPFMIDFLKTKHPVPCYGMRINDGEKTIVYTADTAYDEEWIKFSEGADLLITDCNFYAEQDGEAAGHMTSEQGGYIAAHAQVNHLLLSHLPQYGNKTDLIEEAMRHYNGPITLANEGLIWDSKEGFIK
ncbi:MAG TPA: MBL fold metallo-hydrolase [Bacillota bacterium]|nr:MBL fold metallo-hydrolase [Bacillota bacterium]